MAKYLDPKADLTFKKVFGEHADLLMSFLNAILPLPEGKQIVSLEYLTPEMVPENPTKKFSIVDVRCKDNHNRQFIVEMQMCWSPEFLQRTLFNASKAYVRPLDKGESYEELREVYSVGIINDIAFPDLRDVFYHRYGMIDREHPEYDISGFELVFIELPKFRPTSVADKKMMLLWLRFLTEINEKTVAAPQEMLDDKDLSKAIEILEESAYSDAQRMAYDKFWDEISSYRTLMHSHFRRGLAQGVEQGIAQGMEQGIAQGMEQGIAQGMEQGIAQGMEQERVEAQKRQLEERSANVIRMRCKGVSDNDIADMLGLDLAFVQSCH